MYDLYNESKAVELKANMWHCPYPSDTKLKKINWLDKKIITNEKKISVGLISNPNETDYNKLIKIHDKLIEDNQLDTFVHCARVMSDKEYNSFYKGYVPMNGSKDEADEVLGWCENYKGFISYKKIIEDKIT